MKNCLTKNVTNKIETYLNFNQKYKILKKHMSPQKSHTYIINRERKIYIK
jgi:hypothetical protein